MNDVVTPHAAFRRRMHVRTHSGCIDFNRENERGQFDTLASNTYCADGLAEVIILRLDDGGHRHYHQAWHEMRGRRLRAANFLKTFATALDDAFHFLTDRAAAAATLRDHCDASRYCACRQQGLFEPSNIPDEQCCNSVRPRSAA